MTIHDLLLQKRKIYDESKFQLVNSSKEKSYNLLKRLISFKNKKILSIGTSLNNCLIVSA